jgi:hypothetical protein
VGRIPVLFEPGIALKKLRTDWQKVKVEEKATSSQGRPVGSPLHPAHTHIPSQERGGGELATFPRDAGGLTAAIVTPRLIRPAESQPVEFGQVH